MKEVGQLKDKGKEKGTEEMLRYVLRQYCLYFGSQSRCLSSKPKSNSIRTERMFDLEVTISLVKGKCQTQRTE